MRMVSPGDAVRIAWQGVLYCSLGPTRRTAACARLDVRMMTKQGKRCTRDSVSILMLSLPQGPMAADEHPAGEQCIGYGVRDDGVTDPVRHRCAAA